MTKEQIRFATTTVKTITYKGHEISKLEDEIGQWFFIISGDSTVYASFADAKRVINGQPTIYVVE